MAGKLIIKFRDRKVLNLLKRIKDELGRPREALEIVGMVLKDSIDENFRAGGRPAPWTKSKRAANQSGQTLVDTTRLENDIDYRVTGEKVLIGTPTKYGPLHHFGGVIKPKNAKMLAWVIKGERPTSKEGWAEARKEGRAVFAKQVTIPARPFIMAQDEDWGEICRQLFEYLVMKGGNVAEN